MNIQTGILVALLGLNMSAAQASSREVSLAVPGASLHATLAVPEGVARPPVVLILAGSGPTDRDGNGPSGLSTDVYRKLAGALTAAGYAVLRPDKRGVGSSAASGKREEALTFSTYVQDARAWLTWLGQQPDLGKVVVIGHSEGALVGLAACLDTTEPVGAYVSLAGAGDNIADTLSRQLHANPANPAALTSEADGIIASLRGGQSVPRVSPALAALFRPGVQPYLISWMRLEPAELIARLKVPALIVQGDRDLQVGVQDAQRLARAQPGAKLRVVAGMNHVLVDAPQSPAGNLATYTQPKLPLSRPFLQSLITFLDETLK